MKRNPFFLNANRQDQCVCKAQVDNEVLSNGGVLKYNSSYAIKDVVADGLHNIIGYYNVLIRMTS